MCDVTTENPTSYPVCLANQHDGLLPFFLANQPLKLYYTAKLPTLPDGERKQHLARQLNRVQSVLDGSLGHDRTPFCSPGVAALGPSQYDENALSKRLTFSLSEFLPDDLKESVQYTGHDGLMFGLKQALKSGIPNEDYLLSCYVFQGASDISIKNKPVLVDIGLAHADDSSSGEECTTEHGKQADPVKVSMPPKLGELLAAMHISLVQKVVKMFKHKPGKARARTEVKNHGMYIHKALGSYVCELTIPVIDVGTRDPRKMEVCVTDLSMGNLTEGHLCFSLSYNVKRDQKRSIERSITKHGKRLLIQSLA